MGKLVNPLETLVGYQLRRASSAAMAEVGRNLEILGVTPTEASVLLLISLNADTTQSGIGRALGIQRANMAPLTARLEQAGLIVRSRADGRSHALRVTATGEMLCGQILTTFQAHDAQMLRRLPPTLRDSLRAALGGLHLSSARRRSPHNDA